MKARWAGYFERLYQADPPAVELDVGGVTITIADSPINCGPPSFVETQAAVNRFKWGKAPGICGIHAELIKAGGNAGLMSLHAVLCSVWNTGILPTDWKRGLVVPEWKGKSYCQDCNNYRRVMLLSVPGKVFAQIILDRVRHQPCWCLSTSVESSQALHQRGQRLTVSLLSGCSLNADEFRQGLLAAFVDLCKAFDSVNRDALWKIIGLHGVPPKLINLMSELHSGTECSEMWGYHL